MIICYICGRPVIGSNVVRNRRGGLSHASCFLNFGVPEKDKKHYKDLNVGLAGKKNKQIIITLKKKLKEEGISKEEIEEFLTNSKINANLRRKVINAL